MIDLSVRPSRRRAVVAHLVVGGLLQLLFVGQSLVVLPLALVLIGKEAFGFWLATGGLLGWLSVANFGVAGLTLQRCATAYGGGDLAEARDWFVHGMVFSVASAVLLVCLVLPAAVIAPGWLGATGGLASQLGLGMIIAGCGFAVTPINDTARGFMCALQRNGLAMGAELVAAAVAFGFTVWALLAGWGISGLAWGAAMRMLVATFLSVSLAVFYARVAAPGMRWSRGIVGEYARHVGPLWSASVVAQVIAPLPVVLLTKLLGPEGGPLAAVAYTATIRPLALAETFAMHAVSSTSAAISHLVEDRSAADVAPQRIRLASRGLYVALCAGLFLYCLGDAGFVGLWVGRDAFLGQQFVFVGALASFALIQFRWLTNLGTSLGFIAGTAKLQSAEGAARAALMAVGIVMAGPIGIPLAASVTLASAAVIMEQRLREHPGFPREGTGRLRWLLIAGVASAAGCAFSPVMLSGSWTEWLVCMALAAAGVVALLTVLFPDAQRAVSARLWPHATDRRAQAT